MLFDFESHICPLILSYLEIIGKILLFGEISEIKLDLTQIWKRILVERMEKLEPIIFYGHSRNIYFELFEKILNREPTFVEYSKEAKKNCAKKIIKERGIIRGNYTELLIEQISRNISLVPIINNNLFEYLNNSFPEFYHLAKLNEIRKDLTRKGMFLGTNLSELKKIIWIRKWPIIDNTLEIVHVITNSHFKRFYSVGEKKNYFTTNNSWTCEFCFNFGEIKLFISIPSRKRICRIYYLKYIDGEYVIQFRNKKTKRITGTSIGDIFSQISQVCWRKNEINNIIDNLSTYFPNYCRRGLKNIYSTFFWKWKSDHICKFLKMRESTNSDKNNPWTLKLNFDSSSKNFPFILLSKFNSKIEILINRNLRGWNFKNKNYKSIFDLLRVFSIK